MVANASKNCVLLGNVGVSINVVSYETGKYKFAWTYLVIK